MSGWSEAPSALPMTEEASQISVAALLNQRDADARAKMMEMATRAATQAAAATSDSSRVREALARRLPSKPVGLDAENNVGAYMWNLGLIEYSDQIEALLSAPRDVTTLKVPFGHRASPLPASILPQTASSLTCVMCFARCQVLEEGRCG